MTTTVTMPCIGEPISWLRLEQFALSRADKSVGAHVESCPACRACLGEIERDVVALPPLAVPEGRPGGRIDGRRLAAWWRWALPGGLAVAAAAILLLVLRPRTAEQVARLDVTQVKGVGTVELTLVRERSGVVRSDVRTFAAGDRWKVLVTCASDKTTWVEAFVLEAGATAPDHPLDPARITCGNDIALPGAFAITGDKVNTVCVRVSTDGPPARDATKPGSPGVACVELAPE